MTEYIYDPEKNFKKSDPKIIEGLLRAYDSAKVDIDKDLVKIMNAEANSSIEALYNPDLYEDQ